VSLVAVGFSRDLYALRPEKYPGEPVVERLTSKGDSEKSTEYAYNPTMPAWQNFRIWEEAGRPSKDRFGAILDVRGKPISDSQDFSPRAPE
jgi:hypothetical protein